MISTREQLQQIPLQTIDGKATSLKEWEGKTLLIVNVASKCGLTPQYAGLEELYRRYQNQGLVILGFPCNQFGAQEPGDEKEIQSFCSLTYNVSFPMFAKVEVNGEHTHPLYELLKKEAKGLLGTESIKWNFTKFLITKDGKTISRFSPQTTPEELEKEVQAVL
jgi:glutathione peroxidase